jgi:hypothetical protein
MTDLKGLGWFPKEWIVTHFTDLSPDEILELKDLGSEEEQGGEGGGSAGGLGGLGGGIGDLGDIGGDSGMDLGGDVGGAEMGGAEPAEEQASEVPVEGFDYKAERRLIMELRKQNKIEEGKRIVEGWARRLDKPLRQEEKEYNSGFDHILQINELDGLSRSVPPKSAGTILESIHDPNNDEGIIVDWSVDQDIRSEAIKEVYEVLVADIPPEIVSSEDISPTDLPDPII